MDTRTVLRILFSLLCVKYSFFWCYGRFRFEGNNKYAEKVLRQPWNALTLRISLSLRYDLGRFPFDQKFRKFWVKSEWKGHFPEYHFGILGVPRELVPIFRKIGITGKFCSIRPFLLSPVSPRPKLSTWLPRCSNVPNPEKRRLVL